VERVAENGRVAMLSRQGRWRWGSRPIGVTGIACDITETGEATRLYELFRGAKVVVNLAGTLWKPSVAGETYQRVHVDGTRLILDALHAVSDTPVSWSMSAFTACWDRPPQPKAEADEPAPSTELTANQAEGERLRWPRAARVSRSSSCVPAWCTARATCICSRSSGHRLWALPPDRPGRALATRVRGRRGERVDGGDDHARPGRRSSTSPAPSGCP
jgi:hypothetical protein